MSLLLALTGAAPPADVSEQIVVVDGTEVLFEVVPEVGEVEPAPVAVLGEDLEQTAQVVIAEEVAPPEEQPGVDEPWLVDPPQEGVEVFAEPAEDPAVEEGFVDPLAQEDPTAAEVDQPDQSLDEAPVEAYAEDEGIAEPGEQPAPEEDVAALDSALDSGVDESLDADSLHEPLPVAELETPAQVVLNDDLHQGKAFERHLGYQKEKYEKPAKKKRRRKEQTIAPAGVVPTVPPPPLSSGREPAGAFDKTSGQVPVQETKGIEPLPTLTAASTTTPDPDDETMLAMIAAILAMDE